VRCGEALGGSDEHVGRVSTDGLCQYVDQIQRWDSEQNMRVDAATHAQDAVSRFAHPFTLSTNMSATASTSIRCIIEYACTGTDAPPGYMARYKMLKRVNPTPTCRHPKPSWQWIKHELVSKDE
jgi:hypothetical protein